MNTQRMLDMWKAGLFLVLFCLCGAPQLAGAVPAVPTGPLDAAGGVPDYYTTANWANSPPLAKFVDTLPTLTSVNAMGQYLTLAKPDVVTYPGSDYYEIDLVEYRQRLHPDLPATSSSADGTIRPTTGSMTGTLLRGYVQVNNGTNTGICGPTAPVQPAPACTLAHNTVAPDPVKFLGPNILAVKDRPVRIKFRNRLPAGEYGELFVPVDLSVMGAGKGPALDVTARGDVGGACNNTSEPNSCASYPQNRSDIHLHGGRTPWISDGTPHQWITPVEEITPFTKGVSFYNVPDMPDPGDGATTYYYSNQQSARLMFYHEHAFGITRLNPYVGVAAGYLLVDKWELDLIDRGVIPPLLDQIPLVIQDRTFVDATMVTKYIYNPASGLFDTPIEVPKVRETDPLWNWGSSKLVAGERAPVTGDLWMPHVYMPAQNQVAGSGGVNPFGRWMYGPWFYPATVVEKGPVPNPYYDPNCSSPNPFELADCSTPGQPTQIPGTPNVSMGMEAFQDSVMVNGAVFPTLTVEPRAYRFRVLNAANDRFWNLSFYKADPAQISPDTRPASRLTEVKMVAASASNAAAGNWPPDWPIDGRDGGVPDPGSCVDTGTATEPKWSCTNWGPSFLQIGTEGGFLPAPVQRDPQPVTYITDPTAFWVGIVDKTGLALGPAERADVIVDFTGYEGQTLILYNDAPAAWPARVPGYDYYTNAPDMRDSGGYGTGGTWNQVTGAWEGGTGPLPGYAPNTRTVMQVIVSGTLPPTSYAFNRANLEKEFTAAAPVVPGLNPEITGQPTKTLFERAQEPIIVGQAAYTSAYPNSYFPTNFPWEGIAQINDQSLNFVTLAGQQVNVVTEPKGIHDEMGASFDPVYGRMSGNLGMQLPNPTTLNALLVLYGYNDLPTEFINNSTQVNVQVLPGLPGQPGTVTDGTQIWKISHNGVDTHPIHFHIFDVQLVNRVGWDGQIALPEPNELGWKDTIKISPLMDTIVAVRPKAPALPFGLPNSIRPLNPAIPIDSAMGFGATPSPGSTWPIPLNNGTLGSGFSSIDWNTGQAYIGTAVPPFPYPNYKGVVTNVLYNFGWEYVWHCHILSHEEMDMMRTIVLNYEAMLPPSFPSTVIRGTGNVINWDDPTVVDYLDLGTFGNPANEVGFNVYLTTGGAMTKLNPAILRANFDRTFTHTAGNATDTYIVEAFNAKGSTYSYAGYVAPPTPTISVAAVGPFVFPASITLNATVSGLPATTPISEVAFYDGAVLLGTSTTAPYSLTWTTAAVGPHTVTARINSIQGMISAPITVTVTGALTVNFTPNSGTTFNVCDNIIFTSIATPALDVTGYSWLINGVTYNTQNVSINTLPVGVYPVTLGVVNANALPAPTSAQVTKTISVINNHPPTANAGGPYPVVFSGTNLLLNGTGTDPDTCEIPRLTYAWDVDNKNGYEFFTGNPSITYNSLHKVLGGPGVYTMKFKATDPSGAFAETTQTVTLAVATPATITVPTTTNNSGSYTVSWAASATPGVTYVLQESTTTDFTFSPMIPLTGTSYPVTGKTNGSYYYRVKAVLPGFIDSSWKTSSRVFVSLRQASLPVSISVPFSSANGSYSVSWGNSASPGATYVLQEATDAGFTQNVIETTGAVSPLAITGKTNGTYYYRVKAQAIGYLDSAWRTAANGCLVTLTPAGPPASITVPVSSNTGSYSVSWGASPSPGATYVLQEATNSAFTQNLVETAGTVSPVNYTGKGNGTYYYRVKAQVTGFADSSWTTGLNGCLVALPATPPASITVPTSSLTGSYSVSWTASPTPGATYVLQEATDAGFTQNLVETVGAVSPKVITGKTNGTYYYRVKSRVDGYLDSAWMTGGNGCVVTVSSVTSPNGGEILAGNSTFNVTWTPWAGATNYNVYYSTNGGSTWVLAASGVTTTSYNWVVANVSTTTARIRVTAFIGATSPGWDASDNNFTITSSAPPAAPGAVTSPNGGETLTGNSIFNVTWTPWTGATNYNVYYSTNGGSTWVLAASGVTTTSYNWTVANVSTTTARIRVTAFIGATSPGWDASDNNFTITSGAPPATPGAVTSPNGGETLTANSIFNVTWTPWTGATNYNVYYSTNGGSTWILAASGVTTTSYNWTVANVSTTTARIRVTAFIGATSPGWDASDGNFAISP